jgi:hypothetical protein
MKFVVIKSAVKIQRHLCIGSHLFPIITNPLAHSHPLVHEGQY